MENYTYPQNAQIINVIGEVRQNSSVKLLQVGDTIESNNILIFAKNSELILSLEDGSQQRVYHSASELKDEVLVEKVSTFTYEQSNENSELNNVQDDIAAIQDLITSGEDVELPDTAAGIVGNEGTGFVSVNRTGDETLAEAGVDSNELQNDLTSSNDPDQALASFLADDDEIEIIDEDISISGNVLNNSENPSAVIVEFSIEGTTYETGTTAALDEGELTLSEDGSYTFVPSDDYNGLVPVATYTLEDGTGARDTSTLSITVTPLPDIIDEDEIVTTNEDITITGNVLTNSSSPDDPITVTGFEVAGETYEVGSTAILEEGELTLNENGDYTFIPSENYNGSVPVTTYTLIDGAGDEDTSTLTIAINPVQDLVDDDEAVNINEDTSVTGNVLINATSPDNPITVTSYEISGTTFSIGTTASITEGDLTLNADGSYIFVPSDNFNGTVPVATYTVEDGVGDTDTSTLSITVTPMPDLIDGDENVNVNEDTTLTGNVLTNASSPDNPLTVNSFSISGVSYNIGDTAGLAEGDLTLNANGNYTFVPSPNYNGAVPVVTYTVEDGAGDTDNSTLSITVTPVSDLIDGNENVSTSEDTVINGNVLTNSSSPDNPVTVTSFSVSGISYNIGDTANLVEGNLTLNANGNYTFDPSPEFSGNVPVVTYTVEDGAGDTDNSSLSIRVVPAPPEDSPTNTIADSNATAEDTTLTVTALNGVLANDSDADDILTVASFTVDTGTGSQTSFTAGQTALITGVGSLTLNGDGGYTFDPADNYNGPVPIATYSTNTGASDTLTITVTPVNDEPVAENDSFSVEQSGTVTGNIITQNDGDGIIDHDGGDGSTLNVTHVNGAQLVFSPLNGNAVVTVDGGTLTIDAQGDFTYQNTDGFVLGSSYPKFEYTLSDGIDDDTAEVTITINDTAPLAVDDNNYIQYRDSNGESVRTGVRGNIISSGSTGDRADSSADGNIILTQIEYNGSTYQFDALNTSFNINTGFGTLAILNTGYYTYTLDSGIDINTIPSSLQFTYTIKDGDTINPETDDAILTVNLTHFQTSPRAAKSSNDDELIDLSFIEQTEQDNVNEEINISSPTAELSDLFSDNNHNVLHELLSFNSISEEEPISPDHELILDNTDPNDVNSNEDTIVTNGFLKEGARLQGDITPENVPQHTEIDSNDIL